MAKEGSFAFSTCSQYPLIHGLFSMVSIPCKQLWSKNVKWKIPEINNSYLSNCMPFWVVWQELGPSLPSDRWCESFLCPVCLHCICYVAALSVTRSLCQYHRACIQVTFILLNNHPNHKSSDAGNFNMPKRSWKGFLEVKRWKFLIYLGNQEIIFWDC